MARLYADENFPLPVVEELRRLGHDVLTALEAGNANQSIDDPDVLTYAHSEQRALLTLNRQHFARMHKAGHPHSGIIACTFDPDFLRQAARIHASLDPPDPLAGELVKVNRPNP